MVYEYKNTPDPFNAAIAILTNNYPETGYVMNENVDELLFVVNGYFHIEFKEHTKNNMSTDDVVIISKKKTPYCYIIDGPVKIFIHTKPEWTSEQHKPVTD